MALSRLTNVLSLLALSVLVAGCDLVGDILEFGFWVVIILAVLIALLIWWVARKIGGSRRRPPPPPPTT